MNKKFVVLPSFVTRNIQNNNPGNIRYDQQVTWKGEIGFDSLYNVIFDTPIHGIRAMGIQILSIYQRFKAKSLDKIAVHWSELSEEILEDYTAKLSLLTGIKPEKTMRLLDFDTLFRLTNALIHLENGRIPYNVEELSAGVKLALQAYRQRSST